jgi:predicted dehydrogenase
MSIINAIKHCSDISLYGIASRDHKRAIEFAKKWSIPRPFKSYEELLKCQEIDAVYIALPNHLHAEWIIRSAKSGKHILIEKPLCLQYTDVSFIREAINKSKVILIEGLMVQHHPWQTLIRNWISEKKFGSLYLIRTQISEIVEREPIYQFRQFPEFGGGAFFDFGPYWLQFLQSLFPLNICDYRSESLFDGPNNTDWSMHVSLKIGNVFAKCLCSFESPFQGTHTLFFGKNQ